jgi:hypothetical protein
MQEKGEARNPNCCYVGGREGVPNAYSRLAVLVYCAAVLSQLALMLVVPGGLPPLPTNPFLIIAAVAAEALGPFVLAGILP